MTERLRQILLIAAFVLVVFGFFYLIYAVFFRPSGTTTGNNNNGFVNGLPTPGNSNVNRVGVPSNVNQLPAVNGTVQQQPSTVANGGATSTETVVSNATADLASLADHSALVYYDAVTGKFYKLTPDGQRILLTDATYHSVQSVAWSPNGNQAILTFPDNSKVLYNFETKKQTTLPSELNQFSFSPDSTQIASKYLDASNTDNQWLVISQPDGSQSVSAEHLGDNADKVDVNWSPNTQIIATYEKTTNTDQSDIYFLGSQGQNFQSVTVPGQGFTGDWSPDGRRLLYSIYSSTTDENPHLYIMTGDPNQLGASTLDLGLDTTADKCTFSQNGFNIYCAVPYYLNPGSGPQPSLSAGVPDNIYKINLVTNTASLIARPVDGSKTQRFSATNLQLTAGEDMLYFTDANTGTIQRIRLR